METLMVKTIQTINPANKAPSIWWVWSSNIYPYIL